ncbi:DUF1800 domain-containing protein [Nocardioides sp. InS609-2]|uniref:DUF1800 domain-containing protein n=1 Tax=Nocardioides sp. InS609-2 TaxID=2760705 RepID=UPI0020BD5946|nr:DUF1800 domain-containing protein [Nocardioides sp. InS609-2]
MSSATSPLGRRALVGAGLGTAAVLSPFLSPAADALKPRRRRSKQKLLSKQDRHLVTRFSFGLTPELARDVRRRGGAEAWFERQLKPSKIRDGKAEAVAAWWPSLRLGPGTLWQRQITDVEAGYQVMNDYVRAVLLRNVHSERQVLEVMTSFWENHLHVPAVGDPHFTYRADYGRVIRKHALGRFDEMLLDATTHPANLMYFAADRATKEHPNENLGRELLELHTVGVGNYTERDVVDSARILTGWTVDREAWKALYLYDTHYRGRVKVKGFKDKNNKADGKSVTRDYLKHLAHHPDTARHLATKLAIKFVSDDPPASLVRQLARVYLENDTAIAPVLRALVASKAFKKAEGKKVRDAGEDVVATLRVLAPTINKPPTGDAYDDSGVAALLWQTSQIGPPPHTWSPPDGAPIDNDGWSSPSRLLGSMSTHYGMAGGWSGGDDIVFREPVSWLPKPQLRFDEYVDFMSERILHRPATGTLMLACKRATGYEADEPIDVDHPLADWMFPRFLATFLDSPDHFTR